ncbi:MAG TPA: hypothetical protein VHG30_06145 [Microvirga sp.]|nr:hypothetical protein [Microvirga sp.]
MSDQPQEPIDKKRAVRVRGSLRKPREGAGAAQPAAVRIGTDATAALSLAVSGGESGCGSNDQVPPAAGRAPVPAAANGRRLTRHAAAAAAALVAATGGWFGAQALSVQPSEQPWIETASALRRSQDDVARLTGEVTALKASLAALGDSIDRARNDAAATQAQLLERLERSDRMPQETATRLVQLSAQLDRIETAAKDPGPTLAGLSERLERIERQIAAAKDPGPTLAGLGERLERIERQIAAAGSLGRTAGAAATGAVAAASAPAAAASAAPEPVAQSSGAESRPKETPVEGWVLHDVHGGLALIESRNRRLFEVGPGAIIPGVGRVETIERRGRRWVVVTAKGIIGTVR